MEDNPRCHWGKLAFLANDRSAWVSHTKTKMKLTGWVCENLCSPYRFMA